MKTFKQHSEDEEAPEDEKPKRDYKKEGCPC